MRDCPCAEGLKTDVTPVTMIAVLMTTSKTAKRKAMMMSHGIVMVMMKRSMSFFKR